MSWPVIIGLTWVGIIVFVCAVLALYYWAVLRAAERRERFESSNGGYSSPVVPIKRERLP